MKNREVMTSHYHATLKHIVETNLSYDLVDLWMTSSLRWARSRCSALIGSKPEGAGVAAFSLAADLGQAEVEEASDWWRLTWQAVTRERR